jgi:NDP-sugar pyrophosphorylase family protein
MDACKIIVMKIGSPVAMEPVVCCRKFHEIPVAGIPLEQLLKERLAKLAQAGTIKIHPGLWPSDELLDSLSSNGSAVVIDDDGSELLVFVRDNDDISVPTVLKDLRGSMVVRYPWDLVELNSQIVGALTQNKIVGTVRERVSIDGIIELGEGSVLLPGVFIEGNVVIGKNCKIGPNCYIRGNTSIGDNCHIGQAVEIKNSLFMDNISAGHLSYIGDSVICSKTNLGAATITANLRHDGKNHSSMIDDSLVDTGRRKLGVIIGDEAHTGINTSIYPGRKIWPHGTTRPAEVVKWDITTE